MLRRFCPNRRVILPPQGCGCPASAPMKRPRARQGMSRQGMSRPRLRLWRPAASQSVFPGIRRCIVLSILSSRVGGGVNLSAALGAGLPGEPHRWRSRDLLTRIGTVFQEPEHQFVASTVQREVETSLRVLRLSPPAIEKRVSALVERLRLDHLAAANPYTLSGGEQRRLTVASV